MAKLKGNYTMGYAMDYCNRGKLSTKLIALVGAIFPYFPPYYMGFDTRFVDQVPIFYFYLGIYYILYLGFLGRMTDKQGKTRKIIAEKAILLGCPIELKTVGGKASNSYSTTVMVNAEMREKLRGLGVEDPVALEDEVVALAEPYVEKFSMGAGTSARFLSKNIPHYDKARIIGEIPNVPS